MSEALSKQSLNIEQQQRDFYLVWGQAPVGQAVVGKTVAVIAGADEAVVEHDAIETHKKRVIPKPVRQLSGAASSGAPTKYWAGLRRVLLVAKM